MSIQEFKGAVTLQIRARKLLWTKKRTVPRAEKTLQISEGAVREQIFGTELSHQRSTAGMPTTWATWAVQDRTIQSGPHRLASGSIAPQGGVPCSVFSPPMVEEGRLRTGEPAPDTDRPPQRKAVASPNHRLEIVSVARAHPPIAAPPAAGVGVLSQGSTKAIRIYKRPCASTAAGPGGGDAAWTWPSPQVVGRLRDSTVRACMGT